MLATKTEKEGSNSNKTSKRRRGQTEIGVKMAACCPKSKCGSHTEADLVNLVEQNISKGYLQATRKTQRSRMGECGIKLLWTWKRIPRHYVVGKGKQSTLVIIIPDKTP